MHGAITQLLIWIVIMFNSQNYNLTKQAAIFLPVCLAFISYMTSQFIMTSQQQMMIFSIILIMTSQLSLLYLQTQVPIVQHPQPVKSVARCISWLHKSRKWQGQYDPESIVLLGHSAGGHLATLLALDNTYLTNAGCHPSVIKGIISMSGVYSVPRIATSWMAKHFIIIPGFGTDQSEWEKSSPLTHVKNRAMNGIGIPKFLLFCAESEFPFLQKDASDLSDKFNEFDVSHEYFTIKGTNHFTIASNFGRYSEHYNEHVTKRCIDFILGTGSM
ncbi:unnamed protein product [Owenia fusiformis]|uniref:Alpha/beta hydrolase fold-3 domain-containing protein n=1 Tax=Owenia fusiformis TaxID=6347 RepID=A0A8S4QAE7_OWEFU|nr:unnamed protein product [Owenia fusiformis]